MSRMCGGFLVCFFWLLFCFGEEVLLSFVFPLFLGHLWSFLFDDNAIKLLCKLMSCSNGTPKLAKSSIAQSKKASFSFFANLCSL